MTDRRCPRCKGPMGSRPALDALSRVDDKTMVCSQCGSDEGLFMMHHHRDGVALPPLDQPVFTKADCG